MKEIVFLIGGTLLGIFVGYFAGYVDYLKFNRPYWNWHLEKDKQWKRHVAKEYKNWLEAKEGK